MSGLNKYLHVDDSEDQKHTSILWVFTMFKGEER